MKAIDACSFWAIDRSTFKRVVEDIVHKEFDENRKFIEETKFFSKKIKFNLIKK